MEYFLTQLDKFLIMQKHSSDNIYGILHSEIHDGGIKGTSSLHWGFQQSVPR